MNDGSVAASADDFSRIETNELEDALSGDLRVRVKRELELGERLLSAACSLVSPFHLGRGFLTLAAVALFLIIPGISYVTYAFCQPRATDDFIPAGVSFLGFGGAFVVGLVVNSTIRTRDRRRTASLCNAVTDHRAIVWAPEADEDAIRIQTVARGQVGNLVRIERPDGSVTLEFSRTNSDFDYYQRLKFENIPDVRRVEQIVRNNLMTIERSA